MSIVFNCIPLFIKSDLMSYLTASHVSRLVTRLGHTHRQESQTLINNSAQA